MKKMSKEEFFEKNKDVFDIYKKRCDDIYEKYRDEFEKGGYLEHGGISHELRIAGEWLYRNLIRE